MLGLFYVSTWLGHGVSKLNIVSGSVIECVSRGYNIWIHGLRKPAGPLLHVWVSPTLTKENRKAEGEEIHSVSSWLGSRLSLCPWLWPYIPSLLILSTIALVFLEPQLIDSWLELTSLCNWKGQFLIVNPAYISYGTIAVCTSTMGSVALDNLTNTQTQLPGTNEWWTSCTCVIYDLSINKCY